MARPKQKKSKMTGAQAKIFDKKHFGEEPEHSGLTELTQSELLHMYNWYNYCLARSDATEFIYDYYAARDKKILKELKKVSEKRISSAICWTARMIDRGLKVPAEVSAKIDIHINEIISKYSEEEVSENGPISFIDKTKEKENFIIGEIEEMLDRGDTFSVYEYLIGNSTPKQYANRIIAYYEPILEELTQAYEASDVKVSEGYAAYKKRELKKLKEAHEAIIADCNRYAENKKVERKPRAKKTVSAEKKLANVQYMKQFDEYQLVSKNPSCILGAKELWIYDARYKDILHIVALEGGFDIKGTTLLNMDLTQSKKKSAGRKSKEIVDNVLSLGKIALRKYMSTIKGDGVEPNGRINKNMLILKSV